MVTRHIVVASLLALATATAPAMAWAQERSVSQPAMPLAQALQRIATEWGTPLDIDPDAVGGIVAKPVVNARSARDAVAQATRGLPVAVQIGEDDRIAVINDVVVTARPNEAETSVLVRGATSSSRLGQSLRDQPRNTQVISAKLLERQQSQTLAEALSNAGGVVVNSATVQGGVSFTVRGFDSNGAVNGLPSASSAMFAAGTTLPLANIERIEVLKGPDAILLGGDNLGGTINIVTKKPNAEERLHVSSDIGSFGLIRGTLDANRALSNDNRFSARIVATAATADRNFGGYRGNEDYLFAPGLRYKNATTDIIVSATLGNQIFGMPPYTVLNTATKQPFDVAFDRPLIGGKDQGAQIETTQFNAEITQKLTEWLTVVGRAQHQKIHFTLAQYSPFVVLNNAGSLLISTGGVRQTSKNDAFDTFARITFNTGAVSHKLVAGMTHVDATVDSIYASDGAMFPYNFLTRPALRPLAVNFNSTATSIMTQRGYYGQYLVGSGPIHLMAGLRRNEMKSRSIFDGVPNNPYEGGKTVPNYGAVVDVTNRLSVFGTLAYGYIQNFLTDRFRNRLPDNQTRNAETGIKWDLFDNHALLNASWFSIRQTNLMVPDPINRRFQIAIPGQIGEGIDVNLSGNPIPGLSLSAAFTRTKYRFLRPSATLGDTVNGQPRDVYSLYASYEHKVGERAKAGIGGQVAGQSSSAIDMFNRYRTPAAVLAHLNGFLSVGDLDINIGVRNLFDRRTYQPTRFTNYLPLGETRTWRLTVGYRFF
ncbi:MAG: TonB-dependent siderophore receptor [Sphingomonas pseudosanguinis]|uniref:TonB-dependent siderophore receptor n=1 Tax=Sphingomonas pseudosanguinis TaxID=413712 RepID=UPI00391DC49D